MDKVELRQQLQGTLAGIPDEQRSEMSKKICQNLIATEEFQRASVVMCFLSLPTEVDTTPIILHAWQQGKTVVVPKVSWQQRHMIPIEINSLEIGLATGTFGLKNPTAGVPTPFEEIDLVVAPGIGFAENGDRLGRGGGYYDHFFASDRLKAVKCGIAFSEQILDAVPTEAHDQQLDLIVTDKGVTICQPD